MQINQIVWGDDSAEKDPALLEYFVTSDSFARLRSKSKAIAIGRKGSGKSALRRKLHEEFAAQPDTVVVNLSPKYNSIRSILNDTELAKNFGQEVFFQHTWLRQILLDCLCAIGHSARGTYASGSMEFARSVANDLQRTSKDLVENISDVLNRIRVKAGSIGELGLAVEKELRNVADADALEFHVKELCKSGAKFVVLVDDLDLGWDNSETANSMLLGLLAATSYLGGACAGFYSCIFLREDVYALLISKTQHSDKYRNVERIRWEKDNLISVINQRINYNRRQQGLPVAGYPFYEVFPGTVGTSNTDNWMIERTLSRPRELLQLARYYSESVEGENPDDEVLKSSEANYSSWKLDDLCTEYSNQYPGLIHVFSYWKTKFFRYKYHLTRSELDEMALSIMADVALNESWFNDIAENVDVERLLRVLYEIGFIGDFVLGGQGGSKTFYSYADRHEPRFEEVQVHPCFRKAVNTVERISRRAA